MNHSMFMPHGWCMTWDPWLIGLHVVTDALIALSYYSIPAALFYVVWRRKITLTLQPILLLFGLFIAMCGAGHAMDIVSIWKPIYWVKGYWNLGTALTSVLTAIVLIPRAVELIRMPETTERLQREADELKAEGSLLRTVIDSIHEGIVLVDAGGAVILQNASAAQILGGVRPDAEWPLRPASGHDLWHPADGRIIDRFTRGVDGYGQLYVLRDRTEALESERARLRLERVVTEMKQAFCIAALDTGLIIRRNASFSKLHGIDPNDNSEIFLSSLYAGDERERAQVFAAIRESCEATGSYEGDTRHRRADGAAFFCFGRHSIYEEAGQRFLVITLLDTTAQKQMEEENARFQTRLLEAAKLESLGLLAGGVAHDFNNLLTGITGNVSLAVEVLAPGDNKVAPLLENALFAAESAARLTRQMLAYSGKGRFFVERIQLSRVVASIAKLVQVSISKDITLDVAANQDLPVIEADGGQLEQVVMNIVINAAESIGDRPGTVAVATGVAFVSRAEIALSYAGYDIVPGNYVWLKVSDDGCGMDAETRSRIFDPFFSTKFVGRGLGLAAVMGIIRGHKGALAVASEPGVGTTFSVLFPVPAGEAGYHAGDVPDDLTGSGTILLVDDEKPVRDVAAKVLEHCGYRVLEASNGLEALRLYGHEPGAIKLVLLDLTMPIMSGEETLHRLRKISPNVPVILTSGYSESEVAIRFAGQNIQGFLQKPFTFKTLAEKVKHRNT